MLQSAGALFRFPSRESVPHFPDVRGEECRLLSRLLLYPFGRQFAELLLRPLGSAAVVQTCLPAAVKSELNKGVKSEFNQAVKSAESSSEIRATSGSGIGAESGCWFDRPFISRLLKR